jgi:hypothetical protein
MDTERQLLTRDDLVDLMKQRGWSLSGIVAADEYSTFAFANEHAGEDEINTLSIVGHGKNLTEDERFANAVRDYLNEQDASKPAGSE